MNDADDSLDDSIEASLRQAHQQIQFRPEWAVQVLSQISLELEQSRGVDRPLVTLQPLSASPKRSWTKVTAAATGLAAGLLLAVLGSVFLASSMNRDHSNDAAKQDALSNNAPTELQLAKSDELSTYSVTEESVTDDSVTAGTGYLATKLSSEAEFEIYVVLPTMPINIAGTTK